MKNKILTVALASMFSLLILAIGAETKAQESDTLSVAEAMICTSVIDRVPAGADTVFPDTVGVLYCFTKIEGAKAPTTISHVWYYQDKKMAEVSLNVGGSCWRTWSSKRILKEWTGPWRVDVTTKDGTVLKSLTFKVKEIESGCGCGK